ncbi:hypothetical protein VCV18_012533 [Metarhizium anisopliae]
MAWVAWWLPAGGQGPVRRQVDTASNIGGTGIVVEELDFHTFTTQLLPRRMTDIKPDIIYAYAMLAIPLTRLWDVP